MCNKKNKEQGQALAEFAIIFPLFIMILFFIIDCAWVGFQYTSFDYAYRVAAWDVGIDYNEDEDVVRSDWTVAHNIKQQIMDKVPLINENDLEVQNAVYYLQIEPEVFYTPNLEGKADRHIRRKRSVRINANLRYVIHPMTPVGKVFFGSDVYFDKGLAKERLLTMTNGYGNE